MKAITIYQPWATLIAHGHKQFETRSWATRYRGNIAIHASKRWTKVEQRWAIAYSKMYPDLAPILNDMPFGAVIVACKLVDCIPTEIVRDELTNREKMFGNYQDKRFAWKFEIVKYPPSPIIATGQQGIWEWNP